MQHRALLNAASALAISVGAANAGITFTLLDVPDVFVTGMSGDAQWIVGSSFVDNSIYRYHVPTGTHSFLPDTAGLPYGLPDVSDDGQRVVGNYQVAGVSSPGVWTEVDAWTPIQALATTVVRDGGTGGAYGISGDGSTVAGLFSVSDATGDSPFSASPPGVTNALPTLGSAGRASCANADGTVLAGFANDPAAGFRHGAAWVNGVMSNLSPDRWGDVEGMNPCGTVLVGNGDKTFNEGAMRWDWNGASWTSTNLGVLAGTDPFFYNTSALGVNAAGDMIVGVNRSGIGPFAEAEGFLWTPDDGMVGLEALLADQGIDLMGFDIQVATAISDDGTVISGWGINGQTFAHQGWMITIDAGPDCPADLAEPLRVLNFFDVVAYITAFNNQDPIADFAAPAGVFNFFDLVAYLDAFNAGCP